ncbi:MAG: hypothetical protein V9G19_27705 [Tetrasphaera sp.]
MTTETRTVRAGPSPRSVLADGKLLQVPTEWALLPAGRRRASPAV